MNKLIYLLILTSCLLTSKAYALDCLDEEGCPLQVKRLGKYARNGSPDAQIILGSMYYEGKYLKQSYEKSFYWYRKAARKSALHSTRGDVLHEIGIMSLLGQGTEQSIDRGLVYLKQAAEAGYLKSQLVLGMKYFTGDGIEQDFVQARKYYALAAEKNGMAAYVFAEMLSKGLGGEENLRQAEKWYQQAIKMNYEVSPQKLVQATKQNTQAPSENEHANKERIITKADENILVVYPHDIVEFQMMDLFIESIQNQRMYSQRSSTSRIAGRVCGDGASRCESIFPTAEMIIYLIP